MVILVRHGQRHVYSMMLYLVNLNPYMKFSLLDKQNVSLRKFMKENAVINKKVEASHQKLSYKASTGPS